MVSETLFWQKKESSHEKLKDKTQAWHTAVGSVCIKAAIRTESSFDRQRRWFLWLLTETQLVDGLHAEHVRLASFKAMNDKPAT